MPKKDKSMTRNWTPRRYKHKGYIAYCSPACGYHCPLVEYKLAMKQAECAVQQLGPGWEPVLNENMGWFPKVQNSEIGATIHIDDIRGKIYYNCELLYKGHQQWGRGSKTPAGALKKAKEAVGLLHSFYHGWLASFDIPERG